MATDTRAGDALRTIGMNALLALILAAVIGLACLLTAVIVGTLIYYGRLDLASAIGPGPIAAFCLVVSVIIASLLSALVSLTLTRPVRRMTRAMGRLARGDFSARIEPSELGPIRIREVRDFATSYNRTAEELAGTEVMRANFISDFSHEFRTPISSIAGFAQLLREGGLSAEEQADYLGVICEESKRLASLSERVLALSRAEATAILPDVVPIDVAAQLRRAATLCQERWAGKGVRTHLDLADCQVEGNADYLMQLWMNLLDNAMKFSPKGGLVSVGLHASEGSDGEATCWISDSGCGMDAETRAHLFDKFYQGDTTHATEGNGLGLALCRRIVELHGGSIEAHGAPGDGAVFEIRLPKRQG